MNASRPPRRRLVFRKPRSSFWWMRGTGGPPRNTGVRASGLTAAAAAANQADALCARAAWLLARAQTEYDDACATRTMRYAEYEADEARRRGAQGVEHPDDEEEEQSA